MATDARLDEQIDYYRAIAIDGPDSPIVERRLNDGTTFRAIKIAHQPADLEQRLRSLGWDITVDGAGSFYWGSGQLEAR